MLSPFARKNKSRHPFLYAYFIAPRVVYPLNLPPAARATSPRPLLSNTPPSIGTFVALFPSHSYLHLLHVCGILRLLLLMFRGFGDLLLLDQIQRYRRVRGLVQNLLEHAPSRVEGMSNGGGCDLI